MFFESKQWVCSVIIAQADFLYADLPNDSSLAFLERTYLWK